MSIVRLLLGRRLASREQSEQKVGVLAGVPALGLDGLASSAYGPEALLAVLIPLGGAGLRYVGPITLVIIALLVVLYLSYRQTIAAYPNGGGSYTVAKENLGTTAGLWAAAALMVDYVLNAAVAISAGVAALVSAFPAFHRYTLPLCLGILVLIALVNLRGTSESGVAFALPTYLFLGSFALVLGVGLYRAILSSGHPRPVVDPPPLDKATAAVSLWLLMHAFASGCTAMTGVEAVSNGVPIFRDPPVKNAQRTLTVIVASLGLLLGGISYLCRAYRIGAINQESPHYQSVLSQLVAAVFGRGMVYYVTIGGLLAVLCLSANTSFIGFPRLCRLLARDGFLPRAFGVVGRRLVYSVGIVFLTVTAGLLLVAFGGITDRLIPLFAVGAFLAFTLSQAGMVVHWLKQRRGGDSGWGAAGPGLAINGVGAVATGAALAVILAAKFREGAWITVLAFPALLLLFRRIHQHYRRVERRMRARGPLHLNHGEPPVAVIPTRGWNKLTDKSLRFAVQLSPDVIAVHLTELEGDEEDEGRRERELRAQWAEDVEAPARAAGLNPPRLELINTPYRMFAEPLLAFLETVERDHPRRMVAVLVPELVKRRWWQFFLHNYRAERLRSALLHRGDGRLVVVTVPWYIDPPDPPAPADRHQEAAATAH